MTTLLYSEVKHGKATKTLYRVNTEHFMLNVNDDPIDLLVAASFGSSTTFPSTIKSFNEHGRFRSLGAIFPNAFTSIKVLDYANPKAERYLSYDIDKNAVSYDGTTFHKWDLTTCLARQSFLEKWQYLNSDHIFLDPNGRVDNLEPRIEIGSFVLGLWEGCRRYAPNEYCKDFLHAAAILPAQAELFDMEGRDFANYIAVTQIRAEDMADLLKRRAAIIGNRPIAPDVLQDGPTLHDFRNTSDPKFFNLGVAISEQLKLFSPEAFMLMAKLTIHEAGNQLRGCYARDDIRPEDASPHDLMEATALRSKIQKAIAEVIS